MRVNECNVANLTDVIWKRQKSIKQNMKKTKKKKKKKKKKKNNNTFMICDILSLKKELCPSRLAIFSNTIFLMHSFVYRICK